MLNCTDKWLNSIYTYKKLCVLPVMRPSQFTAMLLIITVLQKKYGWWFLSNPLLEFKIFTLCLLCCSAMLSQAGEDLFSEIFMLTVVPGNISLGRKMRAVPCINIILSSNRLKRMGARFWVAIDALGAASTTLDSSKALANGNHAVWYVNQSSRCFALGTQDTVATLELTLLLR